MLLSGTNLDGVWGVEFLVPRYSPQDTWNLTECQLKDYALNSRSIYNSYFQSQGWVSQFSVQ